ncbi:hypothetical protein [Rhodosalinus sp. FB01]|uniref:hypothetical protein n=1 Tax=Rhodosalinus sp. FB01 TaxID=3239194 RepID=UPI003525E510
MTALEEFERLEASGVWRADAASQRRDVIVSLGDATLTITDMSDRPLAHWSLAAVARANPGELPAIFHPDGDPDEELELPADETVMIDAIGRLMRSIDRRRPQRGRLRLAAGLGSALAILAFGAVWLPGALLGHTVSVVPEAKRAEIGAALLGHVGRVAGAPCNDPEGVAALQRLAARVLGETRRRDLVVLSDAPAVTAHLPGGRILLGRALVEGPDQPDVTAGYVLAEAVREARGDPLRRLLSEGGMGASLRLLTTGTLPEPLLERHTETLLSAEPAPVPDEALLAAFQAAGISSTPYAFARDVTGESVLGLVEADPDAGITPRPVLGDPDWLRLQAICGN